MSDDAFTNPDLTTFTGLDDLGLTVVGQRLEAHRAVLDCRVLEPDDWCRRCGCQGRGIGTVVRHLAHAPSGWRPTTLRIRVRRYRCTGCALTWRQDTTAAAEPRAKLSRGGLRWALIAIVTQHLTIARIAEALAVSWNCANDAVLAEGRRVPIGDPRRLDGVSAIGVDEHVWRHTRRGDKYVTVIIDLTPPGAPKRLGPGHPQPDQLHHPVPAGDWRVQTPASVLRRRSATKVRLSDVPRTGRPKAELVLTDDEREQLQRWTRRHTTAQALALRSRIILACAEGASSRDVAAGLGCNVATVGKWRRRFVTDRLDGLSDEPRPGRPASVTAEQVEDVVVATLEATPKNATHWSRSKMAQRSGLSESTIGRIWKAFGLQPHRAAGFKLSNDPMFVEKVHDVVGLYLNPPEAAVVLCVDEKSQVQALARSQPAFAMMPGMPEKRTHDYVRHGTTTLFAALNIADGTVIASTHRRHRAVEFKKFLTKIDTEVPADLDVHLVCDNYGTHKHPTIKTWLGKHPRVQLHFTRPTPHG